MPQLGRIFTGMRTRLASQAGTDSLVALTIDAVQLTFHDTEQADQERGEANVYVNTVTNLGIATEDLNDHSVRMTILDDDEWEPRDIFVWGEQLVDGAIVPLCMANDITESLSTDPGEAHAGLPLRLVDTGGLGTVVHRLLVMAVTSNHNESGTDDTVRLTITLPTGLEVVSTTIRRLRDGQANMRIVPVDVPFTRDAFSGGGPIRLAIDGEDAWRPAQFYVFGLDTEEGQPKAVVPLVHIRSWNLGLLSTDLTEGQPSVPLPLV